MKKYLISLDRQAIENFSKVPRNEKYLTDENQTLYACGDRLRHCRCTLK